MPGETRKRQLDAAREIVELAGPRQGWRHLALGSTGSGKTWWLKLLVRYAATQTDIVLIHDIKDRQPQYPGATYPSVGSFSRNPPTSRTNVLVFRDTTDGGAEKVARFGWELSERKNLTSLVLIDELYDALSAPMHFRAKGSSVISEIMRKGRSKGVSLATTSQIPQSLPTVVMDLSDTKAFFRMDTRSLNYVESAFRLTPDVTARIRSLGTGEFVLLVQGRDWDGVTYGPQ